MANVRCEDCGNEITDVKCYVFAEGKCICRSCMRKFYDRLSEIAEQVVYDAIQDELDAYLDSTPEQTYPAGWGHPDTWEAKEWY